MKRVLVTARVSAYHFMVLVERNQVFSDRLVAIASQSLADFAVLSSSLHDVWAHRPGTTTHETRNTYFPQEAFETFPFPINMQELEDIGGLYYQHRQSIMLTRQEGLTKTYNRFHDPHETAEDIVQLRELHREMDEAVAHAYGWGDLELGHGFHETKQGLRYTISEGARREVLGRLLKLNHERYAEEEAMGLHEKGAKGKNGRGKGDSAGKGVIREVQGELLFE
jgi:hypothetical protein